ncbi:MAG: DMT family transporter [Bdellovibrionaceae bacterium]|nr:DMT family transporter [Pseudobdellovibrionaceae bacterium]
MTTKNQAAIELLFAGVLWGFGFLAVKWALLDFSVADILFFRYFLAFFIAELYLVLFNRTQFINTFKEWRLALVPGLLMASFIVPQTIGLKYTTATKSGFITTLYVLIVPFLNQFIFKSKIDRKFYGLASLALIGTVLLLDIFTENPDMNQGDWWTLACTFMAALQIIVIGKLAPASSSAFRFNNFQNFWTLICVTPMFLWQDKITWYSTSLRPWIGILALAIGSSIIAFTIQIRAQKVLSPETASQFFLLESPFAFLFGYLFLNETLTMLQLSGAMLILFTTYLTLKLEQTSHSK